MNAIDSLNDVHWHDAILLRAEFEFPSERQSAASVVVLDLLTYKSSDAAERVRARITCTGVVQFSTTVDVQEMRGNAWAGNVSNIYAKPVRRQDGDGFLALWIYLVDGLIVVTTSANGVRHEFIEAA